MPETHIAAPLITTAPALNAQGVEKRALGDQTCGYVNGDPSKCIPRPLLLLPLRSMQTHANRMKTLH